MLDPISAQRLAEIRQQEILQTAASIRQTEWSLTHALRSLLLFGHSFMKHQPKPATRRASTTTSQEMRAVTR
jgi:transposase